MSVACDCDMDGDWYYVGPPDFTTLKTKQMRKCFSCRCRIEVGDECASFHRYRATANDIEERIHGEDMPITVWYACEECAGLYFSITELGYCIMIGDGMTMKQNAQMCGQPEMWE